jgi:hypothetical protein
MIPGDGAIRLKFLDKREISENGHSLHRKRDSFRRPFYVEKFLAGALK